MTIRDMGYGFVTITKISVAVHEINLCCVFPLSDLQKLEREARICRLLKHHNIGEPVV